MNNIDIFEEEMMDLDKEIRLGNSFINEENRNKFTVFPPEASSGKTSRIIKSVAKSSRETLIVTKFKDEVARIVKEINELAKKKKAVGIVADIDMIKTGVNLVTSARDIHFFDYGVIVITHAQYYKLCKGLNNRLEALVKDFYNLIIDEEFNPIKNNMYTFSIKKNLEMLELFGEFGKSEELEYLTNKLSGEFSKDKYKPTNQVHWINDYCDDEVIIETECNRLQEYIKENEDNVSISLSDYQVKNNHKYYIADLIDYLELIKIINSNTIEGYSLIDINAKTITTYDYDFEMFMLKNNIMLDASASFCTIYKSDLFKVKDTKRRINHCGCRVTMIKLKTTTTGKSKIKHLFRPKFSSYVVKTLGESESGLVVTKKDESLDLQTNHFLDFDKEVKDEIELLNSDDPLFSIKLEYKERLSFRNYENQRGRNDYADYKHVFLAHTYRQPRQYYIFLYRYYFNIKATEEEMVTTTAKDDEGLKRYTFHNCQILQDLMFTDMKSSQYQTLKRVGRNRSPQAHYHFFTDDSKLVSETLSELYGFSYKDNFNIVEEEEFLGERVSKRSKLDVLKDYIEERLAQGKWEKIKSVDLQKKLAISSTKWKEIWKDDSFISFCKEKRIKEGKPKSSKVNMVFKY